MTARKGLWQKNFCHWKLIRLGILYISPETASVIGSKWIYDIKVKSDGTLEQYKAQLVDVGKMGLTVKSLSHLLAKGQISELY